MSDFNFDLSSYERKRHLGSGAFGSVYRYDLKRGKSGPVNAVAVKTFKPNDIHAGFATTYKAQMREIEFTNLKHLHIVTFYGITMIGKDIAIVMELAAGTLESICASAGGKTLAFVVGQQILSALQFLHGLPFPVLHRDIKPDNILVARGLQGNGLPKFVLSDFGIAREVGTNENHYQVYRTGIGHRDYVAPEVPTQHYSDRADIYSFAMTLLHVYCGIYTKASDMGPESPFVINDPRITPGSPNDPYINDRNMWALLRSTIKATRPSKRPSAWEMAQNAFFTSMASTFAREQGAFVQRVRSLLPAIG